MAFWLRFNLRAIEALSTFASSNAKSWASSAGVHRDWPWGRAPSVISPSPSADEGIDKPVRNGAVGQRECAR